MNELKNEVFEAIGQASTCWSNLKGAGEFDSTAAVRISEEIWSKIEKSLINSEEEKEPKPIEQILEELKACKGDEDLWAYLLLNKDEKNIPTVTLDNDLTYISVLLKEAKNDYEDDDYLSIDFDHYIGWSDGVQTLLKTLGIKAECC